MKICIAICLGCALVAVGECQDLTALMFQAMGIEAPMLPPTMPSSLREHLYPRQRQQQLLQQQRQQQQQQLQKQRYLAYLTSQQQRQTKNNPYTLSSGSYSGSQRTQPRSNSVYSSANRIRVPGAANSVGGSKGNPYGGSSYQSAPSKGNSYGSSYQSTSNKGNPYGSSYQTSSNKAAGSSRSANPYSNSRGPTRGVPTLRNTASLNPVPIPAHATRLMRTMQTLKAVGEQPRRMHDAQSAGCASPGEGIAGVLMYGDCRNPAAQMACQTEMMSCVNVGMSSMCCPLGMNGLAIDAIGYMNKMQQFVEGFA